MTSLDGIAELHMSGARAVFRPERGASVDQEDVAAAFEEVGMTLESYERVRRPRAAAIYHADAGIT
jgi:hypothetical protein